MSALYFSRLYVKKNLRGIALVSFMFVAIENYNLEYPLSKLPPIPENISKLAELPYAAAAILPFTGTLDKNQEVLSWSEYAKINMTYVLWAESSSKTLFNGYSGQKNKFMRDYPRMLIGFPDERSLATLGRIIGLKYILYVPQFAENFSKDDFNKKIAKYAANLKLINEDSSGTYLFELNPEIKNIYDAPFLLPSSSSNILEFEMRTGFKLNNDRIVIEAYLQNTNQEETFATFDLKADGNWNKQVLPIPIIDESVRPLLLRFRNADQAPLVFRRPLLR